MHMPDIQFRIQNLLERLVQAGTQRGLQAAVYLDGELVVNAWAGTADPDAGKPVEETTLFPVFSVTKGMEATLAHQMVEQGRVSYDLRLAEVWPEFAAHGKENITLRHALNHTAGLPYLPRETSFADLTDWHRMCRIMAEQTPSSAPGSVGEYHAMTYGWLVGEVLRRVDGRDFVKLLHDNIATPLGVEVEMYSGLPADKEARVAILEEPITQAADPAETQPVTVPPAFRPLHAFMNRSDMRRACIPASNGIMSARALARHYAALLPGGVDGVELLPPSRIRLATEDQHTKNAEGEEFTWALGYQRRAGRTGVSEATFGHDGYGGSSGFADPARGLAVGVTRNLFNAESVAGLVLAELNAALPPR